MEAGRRHEEQGRNERPYCADGVEKHGTRGHGARAQYVRACVRATHNIDDQDRTTRIGQPGSNEEAVSFGLPSPSPFLASHPALSVSLLSRAVILGLCSAPAPVPACAAGSAIVPQNGD